METTLKELLDDFDEALPYGLAQEELLAKGHSVQLTGKGGLARSPSRGYGLP